MEGGTMKITEYGYPAKRAAKIIGIGYGTLDYWARTGFIEPSIVQADGRGSSRVYSFLDLVALKVAFELREKGVSLQALRQVVAYLRQHQNKTESPVNGAVLVTDGKRVFVATDNDILIDVIRSGQLVWALALDKAVASLREAAAQKQERKPAQQRMRAAQ